MTHDGNGPSVFFQQLLDRSFEEGYVDRVKHIKEIEILNSNGELIGYRGQRVPVKKGATISETLKVVYTVKKDKELQLTLRGKSNSVHEGEQIEILSTELKMHNTGFSIVRPGHSKKSGSYRSFHRFGDFNEMIPRDFT